MKSLLVSATLSALLIAPLSWKASAVRPPAASHIEWNPKTLRLVARGGNYARMVHLSNGDILCGYGDGRGLWVKRSRDNGQTWDQGVLVVARRPTGNFANAEMLPLPNGNLLLFSNFRPFARDSSPQDAPLLPTALPRFAIGVSRSSDNGASWSPVELVHRAGSEFTNGCWEPAALQLPSGEIQLFFADEGPYTHSDEQQISQLRSFDNGKSWSPPRAVAFRAGHRDGMPVPLQLQNGNLMFAIEDNGLSGSFKPVIVQLWNGAKGTNPQQGMAEIPVGGSSTARWSALKTPLEARVYAGAPFLRQMTSGQTLLSFQEADDGDMQHSQMVVCLGDENAQNFTHASRPFGITSSAQLWSSLLVKDHTHVTAMTSTKIGENSGIWAINGELVRD